MIFNFINALLYFIGYAFCIYCGAAQNTLLPLLFTFGAIGIQLFFIRRKRLETFTQDILLILIAGLFGLALETAFISSGLLTYATNNVLFHYFPPGWLWCIYFLFLITFNHALRWAYKWPTIGLLLGGIGGPVCWAAGKGMGGVTFGFGDTTSLLLIGLAMALYVYIAMRINLRLGDIVDDVFSESRFITEMNVCFDGNCPICCRQIQWMQLRDKKKRLNFVDINNEDFEKKFPNIEKSEAMKEIHAIDDQGKVDLGIKALSRIYACSSKRWLAISLRLPLLHPILVFCYRLFARHRPKKKSSKE